MTKNLTATQLMALGALARDTRAARDDFLHIGTVRTRVKLEDLGLVGFDLNRGGYFLTDAGTKALDAIG